MALDHESPMGASPVSDRPLDEFGEFGAGFMAFGRGAWIGTVAGVGVGLVIGVVNRIVMRIVAVMNGPTSIETDFGAKVLNFTAEGTMFLIIATMLFAIVPGLLYVGLRRFLPGGVVVGGLAFGLLLAAVFGTVVINSQARDFQLLGEPVSFVVLDVQSHGTSPPRTSTILPLLRPAPRVDEGLDDRARIAPWITKAGTRTRTRPPGRCRHRYHRLQRQRRAQLF